MNMMTDKNKSFLGRGWSFPPTFHYAQQQVLMVADEQDIQESLEILLSTHMGERLMQPEFGCNLEGYLFDALNATTQTAIKLTVTEALRRFEPRIRLESVKLDTKQLNAGRIDIAVTYHIVSTNTRHNFVFPFYTKEANTTV
jgi:uncharacterized protein